MTPEQIEQHRKRFEELEIKNGNSIDRYDDCQWYWRAAQNNRWLGYLLCAENMEVELPEKVYCPQCHDCDSDYFFDSADIVNSLISQGIKVKP